MTGRPPFVLVHGGRHGGWAWRRVATHLRRAGHEVHTPTLTGLGERAHLLSPTIGLDTHIADLVGVFTYEDLDNAVLVAHSYGGAVVCAAMEQLADRVRSLVLVDAHMPQSGQSVLDLVGPERAAAMRQRVKEQGEGWFVPVSDASWWGLTDPDDIAWVNTKITPQPAKTYEDPAPSTERAQASAYTFIECSRSRLPAEERAWQRARCENSPRLRHRVVEGSHDVMVDAPEALAKLLLEAQDPPAVD
ncbi:alpha/beta fold hydrolase [Actinoplanes sp. CA-131856]